jgi:hydrogenase nickel incorporation protein HypA/HybF
MLSWSIAQGQRETGLEGERGHRDLTGFVNESIQFYFDLLSKGTEAEKASLAIVRIPSRVRCRDCKKEFQPEEGDWTCPFCGGLIEEVLGGRELYVESIEVE